MADQRFECNWGKSLKSMLSAKKDEKLHIQISGNRIKGKGYISNEEGKNEYLSPFDYGAEEIREVVKGEFQGSDALILVTRLQTLYGAKKTQTILPGCKEIDKAIEALTQVAKENGGLSGDGGSKGAAAPAPAPAPTAPRPAPAPAPVASQTPVAPAPAPAPMASQTPVAPAPAPAPVASQTPVAPPPAPAPAPAPTPVAPPPAPAPAPTPVAPPPAPAPVKSAESFEQKLQKLEIMHESGMCPDDEYKSKKLKLFCDEKGLGDFYEKIQRIFVGKNTGLLDADGYAKEKENISNECFDVISTDLATFRTNTSKIPIIEMSELLTPQEFEQKKAALMGSVAYDPMDPNEKFTLKLQKVPILVEAGLVPAAEYENDKQELKKELDPKVEQSKEVMSSKLDRWPAMVAAGWVSDAEYQGKQKELLASIMAMPMADELSFTAKAERVVLLHEHRWLSDMDFHAKKLEILQNIEAVGDFSQRCRLYIAARDCGLQSMEDYEAKKHKLVEEIFAPYSDMNDFQAKVNMLMKLHETGIVGDEEFNSYKNKLLG